MAAKLIGVLLIIYAIACAIFNFFFHPTFLGVIGSWLFNPLGMLFANPIASYLIDTNSLWFFGGMVHDAIAWAVGGVLAVIYSIVLFFIGLLLVKH